jgi:hypothetical protein
MLANAGHYPKPQGRAGGVFMFPTTAWEENKRTLARSLPDNFWEAWITVMHPVSRIRALVLDANPLQPIEPEILEQRRVGGSAHLRLYTLHTGKPPPSVA